jgi:hypothetical protein
MQIKTLFAALSMLLAGERAAADDYKTYETPHYTVTATDGATELRDYAPRLMAEVQVAGSRSNAASAGFQVLAGYIFGGNEGAAKLAMTTPVAQSEVIAMTTPVTQTAEGADWVVQFMMPSTYTLATLPKAKDPRIRFVELPASRQAVLRFSGLAMAGTLAAKAADLQVWIAAKGLKATAGPMYYFYDPPWTLPWNRRNEVAFVVK